MSDLRKFAVQKPKGSKWETLALVDDPASARHEFKDAVGRFGQGYVRLIQVDFKSEEALSDYDWRLIDLHDPFKDKGGRPKPTVIAATARSGKGGGRQSPPGHAITAAGRPGGSRLRPRPGEKVPVPYLTYVAAFLFGALALLVWAMWFGL